jgi:hypothetical protein
MSVRSALVRETLVPTICERIRARLPGDLSEQAAEMLERRPELARMGYIARVVESELFEPARSPMPGLRDLVSERLSRGAAWPEAVTTVAHELASLEPLDRPEPGDEDAVSWRVPGPGGHVRHYVALRLIGEREAALKRDFMYGFLVRCCEEALSPR